MSKKILAGFFGLAIFMASTAFVTQDQKANAILATVSKTYKSYKTIKAGFRISIDNQQTNSKINQKGTLYLKGKKFRIDMSDQEIYCDGNKMWTYFKEENEVQIAKYDPNQQDINTSEIFTNYKKGFKSKYIGEVLKGNVKVQKIELIPDDRNKPYFKVKLEIEKATHKISSMQILNKNGLVTNYSITSFDGNVDISDSFFKFDSRSKPGVVEIDLTK